MNVIGIDIGTTTISGVLLSADDGKVLHSLTLANDSVITDSWNGTPVMPYEKLQDPNRILELVQQIYHTFLEEDPSICAVGITGQMHGILYTNNEGAALSPLYTWQDESGNQFYTAAESSRIASNPFFSLVAPSMNPTASPMKHSTTDQSAADQSTTDRSSTDWSSTDRSSIDQSSTDSDTASCTYAELLSSITGYPLATGFGLTTLFCHTRQNRIPEGAVSICTIPDYIAMALTGEKKPVTTPSMAASLGCFCLDKLAFDEEVIHKAGIDSSLLPLCTHENRILGYTTEGIPVSVAIGDNQASVIGSVQSPSESLLINIGTGSQVSTGIDHYLADVKSPVELRPLSDDQYILVGASLCGGRAYAALESFFSQVVTAMTGNAPSEKLYSQMNAFLTHESHETNANATTNQASPIYQGSTTDQAPQTDENTQTIPKNTTISNVSNQLPTLQADTRFCGTRENPSLTGSITNLSLDNFTPEAFTKAILQGIAEELCTFHQAMLAAGAQKPKYLIGSGNGLRRNHYLQKLFEDIYQLKLQIPQHQEEASYGCALYALCASGQKKSLSDAQALIHYV